MADATISPDSEDPANRPDPRYLEVGHQGDFDRPQIAARLAMTPTERLRHHEPWRLFVKEALKRAELRRKGHRGPGYDAIIGRAVEMDVAGYPVKVLALEDLIRTKRAAGRPKDLAVLPMLEAILQLLREQEREGDRAE